VYSSGIEANRAGFPGARDGFLEPDAPLLAALTGPTAVPIEIYTAVETDTFPDPDVITTYDRTNIFQYFTRGFKRTNDLGTTDITGDYGGVTDSSGLDSNHWEVAHWAEESVARFTAYPNIDADVDIYTLFSTNEIGPPITIGVPVRTNITINVPLSFGAGLVDVSAEQTNAVVQPAADNLSGVLTATSFLELNTTQAKNNDQTVRITNDYVSGTAPNFVVNQVDNVSVTKTVNETQNPSAFIERVISVSHTLEWRTWIMGSYGYRLRDEAILLKWDFQYVE
jgi:hypothetical protein